MFLTQEQLKEIQNIKSFEELKEKAIENNFSVSDEILKKYYDSINSTPELSDEELDNVTGGCGDKKVVNRDDRACEHYEYVGNSVDTNGKWRYCNYCKYFYGEWDAGEDPVWYCNYE